MSTPPASPELTVCVLAFNEADNLAATVRELHAALTGLRRTFELILINDGSTDGTPAVAAKLVAELAAVRVVHHPVNRGLGGVYRTGFAEARGEFVTFFPADGQFPPDILAQFLHTRRPTISCSAICPHAPAASPRGSCRGRSGSSCARCWGRCHAFRACCFSAANCSPASRSTRRAGAG